MEALYEERLWAAVLGVPELNRREREGVAAAGAQGREQGSEGARERCSRS